jgi:hypothetical protein
MTFLCEGSEIAGPMTADRSGPRATGATRLSAVTG